jgi:hypothetical protein
VLYDVPEIVRVPLHNTLSYDFAGISELQMAAIIFGIHKVVHLAAAQELGEEEFCQTSREMQFFVHKYNEENVDFNALVIFSLLPLGFYFILSFMHFLFHVSFHGELLNVQSFL